MKIKFGIDPTLDRLHLGHWVILNWLKQQDAEIIIVLGDFTATIGDPTGKSKTREVLNYDFVYNNTNRLKQEISELVPNVSFAYNSTWLKELDVLKLLSEWTLNQVIQRKDFKDRLNSNKPITLLELVYPLLQGYDSVYLKPDLEIGGSDQLFNLMVGKDMMGQEIKCFDLLIGLDGTNKMSKSLNNCIYLNESSIDIFSKVMSISDELMENWFKVFGFKSDVLHPKERKKDLASQILFSLGRYSCQSEWELIHEQKIITKPIELIFTNNLIDTLFSSGNYKSKSEIKRLIEQGALKENDGITKLGRFYYTINNERRSD